MAVDLKGQPSNREADGTNGCLSGIHRHDHCVQQSFGCYRIDTLGKEDASRPSNTLLPDTAGAWGRSKNARIIGSDPRVGFLQGLALASATANAVRQGA
jgi:hypothetical protein